MPFWTPPIPPHVSNTGGQPYAGSKLPPQLLGVAVNNAPGVGVPKIVIIDDPPLPQAPQKLSPSISGIKADNPPFGNNRFYSWAWGGVQDFAQSGGNLTQSVDNPPFLIPGAYSYWLSTILNAWIPPPPQPQQGRLRILGAAPTVADNPPGVGVPKIVIFDDVTLPQLPTKLPASVLAVTVNSPPFAHQGRDVSTIGIISAWVPPDPPPVQRGPLCPQLTAVVVNNPPFSDAARVANFGSVLFAWELPIPPLPPQTKPSVVGPIAPPPPPATALHVNPFFVTLGKMTVH